MFRLKLFHFKRLQSYVKTRFIQVRRNGYRGRAIAKGRPIDSIRAFVFMQNIM